MVTKEIPFVLSLFRVLQFYTFFLVRCSGTLKFKIHKLMMQECELFGGAMSWAMPGGYFDTSEVRQVPDNQEVFSNIIELMSAQHQVPDNDAANFFFQDLAASNKATATEISSNRLVLKQTDVPLIPYQTVPGWRFGCVCDGVQHVSKFTNESGNENEIFIVMAILRFPSPIATDILLTISAPQRIAANSSENRVVVDIFSKEDCHDLLGGLLGSLQIRNWDLFVPE